MHHNSIRKYTAALLNFFNNVTVEYKKSDGELDTRYVPISFTSREKSKILDKATSKQLIEGNYNVLPLGTLALVGMQKNSDRTLNKNLKINKFEGADNLDFAFNSVPYDFAFTINYKCRGMTEATQIVEQIVPKFNPTINIDVWDAINLCAPTRIPVSLNGINIESESYSEISTNIVTVTFDIILSGNMSQPSTSMPKVKEFKIYLQKVEESEEAARASLLEWDVVDGIAQDDSFNITIEDQ